MDNNNSWSNPGNWSNNAVPDAQTNVLIPQYKPGSDYPQTFTPSSIEVGDVTVGPGAILRIPSGYSLTVNGDLVIED
jgi:hypothetical protein